MWEARTAPHKTAIVKVDYNADMLIRKGWSYGGDAEFYKYFSTKVDAKYGLRDYLKNEISRMQDIILKHT